MGRQIAGTNEKGYLSANAASFLIDLKIEEVAIIKLEVVLGTLSGLKIFVGYYVNNKCIPFSLSGSLYPLFRLL